MSSKQSQFLSDIIFPHLHVFKNNTDLQSHYLTIVKQYPKSIDVENLIEHALAECGGYNFIDDEYRDFDDPDDSDSKTVTINRWSRKFEVGSIENKIGSIRLTLYNPILSSVAYMYIPRIAVSLLSRACYGKQSHKKRLQGTWSLINGYNMFNPYIVDTFKELATMTDEKFYTINSHVDVNARAREARMLACNMC